MSITETIKIPWLLLLFSLPTKRASQRVEVWRKLQRYGALPLRNSGYLLPNTLTHRERFEWLATAIRNYHGEASVLEVHSIDNLEFETLAERFRKARTRDYQELLREANRIIPKKEVSESQLGRLRRRFQEIVEVDFFHSPLRDRIDELLARAERRGQDENSEKTRRRSVRTYKGKLWITRPRPEIDRVASAWLIRRFIDPRARFAFASDAKAPSRGIRFDMYHGGFGHRGEDCTFETLQKEFGIRDRIVTRIGRAVHDADLYDEKFARPEGFGLDEVLKGWGKQGLRDQEILRRGMEMIEGLYQSLAKQRS